MAKILFGISAWADPGLIRSGFYPAAVKTAGERLSYYASKFPLSELDSSYHFFPTRRNIDLWLENTPAGFLFNVKAFSLFTRYPTRFTSLPRALREKFGSRIQAKGSIYLHHLPEEALNELWDMFTGVLDVFQKAGKLGAVLFQFPPWFYPTPENRDYITSCQKRLAGYRMAVEFRVGNWLSDEHREETLQLLRERTIALVCVDEPQGLKSSVPLLAEVTAPLAIVRFHGRNAADWERKDATPGQKFNYLYQEAELKEWVPRIQALAEKAKELHLIFKNKYADYPVRNAIQMKRLLSE